MTIKPARTYLDKEKDEDRIRFLRRKQQEQEADRGIQDFLTPGEEEEDYRSPPDGGHWDET